jgi:hypothetical protein
MCIIHNKEKWSRVLKEISAQPLEYCENFPEIAGRYEAWWNQELEGPPIFMGKTEIPDLQCLPITLLDEPDQWLEISETIVKKLRYFGDGLPFVRVDLGPVIMSSFLGADREIRNGKAWTHSPDIADMQEVIDSINYNENNIWLKRLQQLTELTVRLGKGKFVYMPPNLGTGGDVLADCRGNSELCMDLMDNKEKTMEALDLMYPIWKRLYEFIYDSCIDNGVGLIQNLALWSNQPYVVPACDFSCMIGEKEYQDVFLPDIERRAKAVGRAIYHLDGTGATRHIDAILEIPEIRAIQFVSEKHTMLPWIDMFKKIQQSGRSLMITLMPCELDAIRENLDPAGLAFRPAADKKGASLTEADMEVLYNRICKIYN